MQKQQYVLTQNSVNTMDDDPKTIIFYKGYLSQGYPLTVQPLDSFKLACLKKNSIIYQDSILEIKEKRELVKKDGKTYLRILLYLINKGEESFSQNKIEFYCEKG